MSLTVLPLGTLVGLGAIIALWMSSALFTF
jgi:hypothetical protein